MSGGSWPLPAGSSWPSRVGKMGRGCGEGKSGPGVPPWGWAWLRGPATGGAGEGGFPPGGGARLASRAEAPGRGRSTPRPLGARWAGGRRFRGPAREAGTGASLVPLPVGRWLVSAPLDARTILGCAPRTRPTLLGLALCLKDLSPHPPPHSLTLGTHGSAERSKGVLETQTVPNRLHG